MLMKTPRSLVYLSADELDITPAERAGLIEVRDDLASGRVKYVDVQGESAMSRDLTRDEWASNMFNMGAWHQYASCGTVHCLAGIMQCKGVYQQNEEVVSAYSSALEFLYCPEFEGCETKDWQSLTDRQAVRAIDEFLSGARENCWFNVLREADV